MLDNRKAYKMFVNLIKVRAISDNEIDEREVRIAQKVVDAIVGDKKQDANLEAAGSLVRLAAGFMDTVYEDNNPTQFVEDVEFEAEHIHESIIDSFKDAIEYKPTEPDKRRVALMNMTERNINDEAEMTALSKWTYLAKIATNRSEKTEAMNELIKIVKKIEDRSVSTHHASITSSFDLDDTEAVSKVFEAMDEETGGLVLKTGFKGLNVQLQGGIKRGEIIAIAAESHNYKSGLALTMFISTILANDAPPTEEGKQATAVWYSLEDPMHHVISMVFNYVYHFVEGKPPEVTMSSLAKAEYIKEKLQARGWKLLFFKADPTTCDWDTPMNVVKGVMANGNEVIMAGFDYLPLLSTKGLEGTGGTELRQLIRNYKNFGQKNNMAIFSPLQASPASASLDSEGFPAAEKCSVMAKRNMTAGSRQLVQELYTLFFIDKIHKDQVPLLICVLAKHKNTSVISDRKKKIIMRFMLDKPIIGDIDKEENEYWHKLDEVPLEDMQSDTAEIVW